MNIWEPITKKAGDFVTYRMRVPGGWLVRHAEASMPFNEDGSMYAVALCFVPDPNHAWRIEPEGSQNNEA